MDEPCKIPFFDLFGLLEEGGDPLWTQARDWRVAGAVIDRARRRVEARIDRTGLENVG